MRKKAVICLMLVLILTLTAVTAYAATSTSKYTNVKYTHNSRYDNMMIIDGIDAVESFVQIFDFNRGGQGKISGYCGLLISYRAMAAAVATFRLSVSGDIGRRTAISQLSSTRRRIPLPSEPIITAVLPDLFNWSIAV